MKIKKIISLILSIALLVSVMPGAISAYADVSANTPATEYSGFNFTFDSIDPATGTSTDTAIESALVAAGGKSTAGNDWVMGTEGANAEGDGYHFIDIRKDITSDGTGNAMVMRNTEGGNNDTIQFRTLTQARWDKTEYQTDGAIQVFEMDFTPLAGKLMRFYMNPRAAKGTDMGWIYIVDGGKFYGSKSPYTIGNTYKVKVVFDTLNWVTSIYVDGVLDQQLSHSHNDTVHKSICYIDWRMVCQYNSDADGAIPAELAIDNFKYYYTYAAPAVKSMSYTAADGNVVESDDVTYDAQSVSVTLDRAIANTSGNITLKTEKGVAVGANISVSADGKTITAIPSKNLIPNTTYNICIDADVTYDVRHNNGSESVTTETRALGSEVAIPFTTQSEVMIVSPENGSDISSTAQTLTLGACVPEDTTLVEFYVDDELMGSASPNENFYASVTANISALTVGSKEVKAICYGDDVSVLYSSFNLIHKATLNHGFVSDFENSAALIPDEYFMIVGDATDKGIVASTDIVAKDTQAGKIQYKKTTGSTGTTGKRYAYLYINGQKVAGAKRMCDGIHVVDTWIYIPNTTDRYTFGTRWQAQFDGVDAYTDAACTTALSLSSTKLNLDLAEENIFNCGQLGTTGISYEAGWHHLRIEMDYDARTRTTYVDCNPVIESSLAPTANATYYLKDSDGNIVCEDGTTTPKAFDTMERPLEMTFASLNHYDYRTTTAADTEYQTAFILDDFCYYKEYEIPEITGVSYATANVGNVAVDEESYVIDTGATSISVTLDGKYAQAAVNSDNVKLYVDGTETAYDSIAYENDVVTITKADAFKENQKLEIVFGANMTLGYAYCEQTVSGMENSVKLYAAKDGLYFDSSVVSKEGLAVAYVDIRSSSEVSCEALLSVYNDRALAGLKQQDITANGKECIVISVPATVADADEAKIMVWHDMTNLTPLGKATSITIQ